MTEALLVSSTLIGLPVVVRITAMVMTMPVFAGRVVPLRVKAALVIAFSVLVIPTVSSHACLPASNPAAYMTGLINEALLGALMGLSLSLILAGVQLAGSLIEGLCGLSLNSFGSIPDADAGNGVVARLFWWTTVAVFIAAGGVGQVVDGMLVSFQQLPVGTYGFGPIVC